MNTDAVLNVWIEKIKAARKRSELFAMLDEFRTLEWSDEQCSKISRLYMRLLDVLPPEEDAPVATAAAVKPAGTGEQEEVWYEKM